MMNNIAFTGKSQQSTLDVQSKKESQFLERYSRYIIKDECSQMFTDSQATMLHNLDPKKMPYHTLINQITQQIQNENLEAHIFYTLRELPFSKFSSYYDKVLDQYNIFQKEEMSRSIRTMFQIIINQPRTAEQKKQLFRNYQPSSFNNEKEQQQQSNFFELYSNKLAKEQDTMKFGEMVIVDTRIKCPSSKAKQIQQDIKRLFDYIFEKSKRQHQTIEAEHISYLKVQKPETISLIILYNGDVNFDFENYLNINSVNIQGVPFALKLKVYYVSKQSLFNHFKETQNTQQKIECITDKIVTFYDMNRSRQQRQRAIKEIDLLKKQAEEKEQKEKSEQQQEQKYKEKVAMYAFLSVITIVGGIIIFRKKTILGGG